MTSTAIDGDRDHAALTQRVTKGADLRTAGMSWERVAQECGYASRGAAYTAVMAHMRELRNDALADMRVAENLRLDRAQAALWPAVLRGEPRSVDSFVRLSARRSRLNGLDAPMQVQISAGVMAELEDAIQDFQVTILGSDGVYRTPDDPEA